MLKVEYEQAGVDLPFVDVWRGSLALVQVDEFEALALLDESELKKAQSFKMPVLRDRFIAVRTLLRQTLATYLDAEPWALRFGLEAHGKPYLLGESLYFNLSHCEDDLVLAVANFPGIGVDVECIKPRHHLSGLAKRCFSTQEWAQWAVLPLEQQAPAFYRLWTKKEAFVKAVGRGLALGLENCEFELAEGGGLLAVPFEQGRPSDWRVTEWVFGLNRCVALVTPNRDYVLRHKTLIGAL